MTTESKISEAHSFVTGLFENNDEFTKFVLSIADDLAYVGFKAEKILQKFIKCAKVHNRTKAEIVQDKVDIVCIGLERGNITRDTLARITEPGRNKIDELIKRYNIKIREKRGQQMTLGGDTLTFVRALSVFPLVASMVIQKKIHKPMMTSGTFFANELPDEMKHSGFASLIPNENEMGTVLFYAFVSYMVEFSFKINPNDKKSDKEKFEEQMRYCNYAWQSTFVPTKARLKIMSVLELDKVEYLPVYVKAANAGGALVGKSFDEKKLTELYVVDDKLAYDKKDC